MPNTSLRFETLQVHAGYQPEATTKAAAGVEPGLLRISLGIEHIDDIKGDLEQAFGKI